MVSGCYSVGCVSRLALSVTIEDSTIGSSEFSHYTPSDIVYPLYIRMWVLLEYNMLVYRLLNEDSIPTIATNLGCSIEEASLFIKEKNVRKMNNISLKQNEDFMKDVVTPTMLQKQ